MYGPITLQQSLLLGEFRRATEAIYAAAEYDGSYEWWTNVAQRIRLTEIFLHAQAIFYQFAKI